MLEANHRSNTVLSGTLECRSTSEVIRECGIRFPLAIVIEPEVSLIPDGLLTVLCMSHIINSLIVHLAVVAFGTSQTNGQFKGCDLLIDDVGHAVVLDTLRGRERSRDRGGLRIAVGSDIGLGGRSVTSCQIVTSDQTGCARDRVR